MPRCRSHAAAPLSCRLHCSHAAAAAVDVLVAADAAVLDLKAEIAKVLSATFPPFRGCAVHSVW